MIRMLNVFPISVSTEDADQNTPSRARYRLEKHLFVFFAVLVGLNASGGVDAAEVHRATSGRELEQEEDSVAVGSWTAKSSDTSSMDGFLIESLSRSGFYSATFDRICQQRKSRELVTGPTGSPPAEMTSEDHRHSISADASYPTAGGASVRLRRSSAPHSGGKVKGNKILNKTECKKVNVEEAVTADSDLQGAVDDNLDEVESWCRSNNEGCFPIPQIVYLTKLCDKLESGIDSLNLRTVIHACPDITCCKTGHRCKVKRSVAVNKTFMIKDLKAVTIEFQNHTECSCGNPPKREKKIKVTTASSKSIRVTSPSVILKGSSSTAIKDAV